MILGILLWAASLGIPEARELSPERRLVVILVTAALTAGVVAFAVRRLKGALWGRPDRPPE
jgi:cytochrome c oxidase assembly factor CtaG